MSAPGLSMRRAALAGFVAALIAACTVARRPEPGDSPVLGRPGAPPALRGLSLGIHRDDPALYRSRLREIRGLGATGVSLVVHWSQRDVRSTDLGPDPEHSVADDAVERTIEQARRIGLAVFLMPIVLLRECGEGEWRGTLAPRDWGAWFAAHDRFILHYARLAARAGVATFAVGSELLSTERRRADWARTIAAVRGVYRGEIVYSANWDHYRQVSFWDLVDALGVNGYFEVARREGSSVAAMRAEWRSIRARLEAFAASVGKPLLLTEVGYPSIRGGAAWPWHYARSAPVDVAEQARAYRAFIEAWADAPALRGVFFWNWWGEGGPADPGYTPRGKPAERVLRRWFGG